MTIRLHPIAKVAFGLAIPTRKLGTIRASSNRRTSRAGVPRAKFQNERQTDANRFDFSEYPTANTGSADTKASVTARTSGSENVGSPQPAGINFREKHESRTEASSGQGPGGRGRRRRRGRRGPVANNPAQPQGHPVNIVMAAPAAQPRPTDANPGQRQRQDQTGGGIYTAPMDHSYRALQGNGNGNMQRGLEPRRCHLRQAVRSARAGARAHDLASICPRASLPSWMTCFSWRKSRRPRAR